MSAGVRQIVLLVVAMFLFLIALLADAGWLINSTHVIAWLAAGLIAFAAAHLP